MTATMIDSRYDARAANCIALSQAASDAGFGLMGRVAAARSHLHGRIVFTTSFGMEDQAIAHAIFLQALEIEVVTLDTGRLFPETYELWAQTESRYGQRIEAPIPMALAPNCW